MSEHRPISDVFRTIFVVDDAGGRGRDAASLARCLAGPDASFVFGGLDSARHVPDAARLEGADLIVMGSHREAQQVLHGSTIPVAVAPTGFADSAHGEVRVIGVAFDGQPEATTALRFAERLALDRGATMRVFAVVRPDLVNSSRIEPTPAEYRQMIRDSLGELLREEVETLDGGVRAAASVLRGDPVEELLEASRAGLDLLVVGSRGYGPIRRVVFGSVSSRVLARAECPVLVLPRGACGSEEANEELRELETAR